MEGRSEEGLEYRNGRTPRNLIMDQNIKTCGSTVTHISKNSRYFHVFISLYSLIFLAESEKNLKERNDEGENRERTLSACVFSTSYSTVSQTLNKPPTDVFTAWNKHGSTRGKHTSANSFSLSLSL